MANEIIPNDPARRALAIRSAHLIEESRQPFEVAGHQGNLATTFFIARKRGGLGASTLMPILAHIIGGPVMFLEVGGVSSPIFRYLPPPRHAHFKSSDPERIVDAIDYRLQYSQTIAVFEFEPPLFKQTIDEAVQLSQDFQCQIVLLYIAESGEVDPQFPENATRFGAQNVVVLGRPAMEKESRPNVIRIPSLPMELLTQLQSGKFDLTAELHALSGDYTKVRTAQKIAEFGKALSQAMAR